MSSGNARGESDIIVTEAPSRKQSSVTVNITKKSPKDVHLIKLALHRSRFFTCLDEDQIQRFIDVAELRTYTPGTAVIRQGSVDDDNPEGQVDPMESLGQRGIESVIKETRLDLELKRLVEERNPSSERLDDVDMHVNLASALRLATREQRSEVEDDVIASGAAGDLDEEIERNEYSLARRSSQQTSSAGMNTANENLAIYAVRSGSGEVWVNGLNPASLGPGTVFGEGAVLFNRTHSATVIASQAPDNGPSTDKKSGALECWVVPAETFRTYVLNSDNMRKMFQKHAHRVDEDGEPYMIMVRFCKDDFFHEHGTQTTNLLNFH